ncbi:MAG: class I SAM-dependent methyltransferase [Oligoflexales bacterium]|nr:class I SAM-dependent methyltransferase [Oligoflexales bacterium]
MKFISALLVVGCTQFVSVNSSQAASKNIFSDIGFLGRNLDLHVEMFPKDLEKTKEFYAGKNILFVPAGPSSIKGELVRDYDVPEENIVTCDIEYPKGGDLEDNARKLEEQIFSAEDRFKALYGIANNINWDIIDGAANIFGVRDLKERRQNFIDHMNTLKENNRVFIEDYKQHPEWMVHCDISDLPDEVSSRQYDLIISSNLLHLYNHVLSDEFHLKAYEQLTSLLAPGGSLLVFPLTSIMGKDHKLVDDIIVDLESKGYRVELVRSDSPVTNDYYKKLFKMDFEGAFYLRVTA